MCIRDSPIIHRKNWQKPNRSGDHRVAIISPRSMTPEPLVIRNHGYRRKFLVIVFSEHCFVTSEAPNWFLQLSSIPPKSEKWDLQFGSGPRPSNKQESCFFNDLHDFLRFFFAFFLKFIGDQNSMQIGSGEVGGGWDRFKMIGRIVGTFRDGFWPKIHWKNNENQWIPMFSLDFPGFSRVFPPARTVAHQKDGPSGVGTPGGWYF